MGKWIGYGTAIIAIGVLVSVLPPMLVLGAAVVGGIGFVLMPRNTIQR